MKIYSILIALSVFLFGTFGFAAQTMATELIEPTRSLKGTGEQNGKLSIFSEPPEMMVVLDGTKIGQTPIISKDIAPGTHVLRIQNKEIEIYVTPGKPLQYSWFKGSFRKIPVKEEIQTSPKTESSTAKKEKIPRKSDQKKIELQPGYWPLEPGGPIF